jgi:carboxypeptidase T
VTRNLIHPGSTRPRSPRGRGLTRARFVVLGVALTALLALVTQGSATAVAVPTLNETAPAVVLRVIKPSPAQVKLLSQSYDLLESRDGADYFVLGNDDSAKHNGTIRTLRAQGLKVQLEKRLPAIPKATATTHSALRADGTLAPAAYGTFYGGYHTTDAQLQHLRDVAAAYPALATVVDYGDSWRKTQGLSTGSDLLAICITKITTGDCARSTTAPKPRSMVISAIHARELATAEVTWNWIDYLTQGYGTDPTITALLNSTEIWVVPVVNPDGRKIVESGGSAPYYQRKNANNTHGSCSNPPTATNQYGVDLNRNGTFHWGGVGSSSSACAQEYRGPTAASEPETQALQSLENSLFADNRGSAITDAAPATATGTFMTYHSYASLVLYPWGDVNTPAPNGTKLRALAAKLASYNGYTYGQPGNVLYNVTGSTDDDLYGRLGVASFTTELGASGTSCDGFMPAFSCVASRFWPQERQSLLALAQAAGGPYK